MFQIWGLVLFYGLLTQSSAQRNHDLILSQSQAKASVQAEASVEVPSTILSEVATSFKGHLLNTNILSNIKKLPLMNALYQYGWHETLQAGVNAKIFGQISSLKVIGVQFSKMNVTQSEDRNQLSATLLSTLNVAANIFFLGKIGFDLKMHNTFQIGTEMDENEDVYLVIQGCNTELVSSKIKAPVRVVNDFLNTFTRLLNHVVPPLVQEAFCSAVNSCLPKLDVYLQRTLVDALVCGDELSAN